jgi:transposase
MWARPKQIERRFGVGKTQVHTWLARLVEQGKVRRWQPETAKGTKGDTYYSLPDLEKAWSLDTLPVHESKK